MTKRKPPIKLSTGVRRILTSNLVVNKNASGAQVEAAIGEIQKNLEALNTRMDDDIPAAWDDRPVVYELKDDQDNITIPRYNWRLLKETKDPSE